MVRARNSYSTPCVMGARVPQGSVLGQLLYSVFTADLPCPNAYHMADPRKALLATYADDIALLLQRGSTGSLKVPHLTGCTHRTGRCNSRSTFTGEVRSTYDFRPASESYGSEMLSKDATTAIADKQKKHHDTESQKSSLRPLRSPDLAVRNTDLGYFCKIQLQPHSGIAKSWHACNYRLPILCTWH